MAWLAQKGTNKAREAVGWAKADILTKATRLPGKRPTGIGGSANASGWSDKRVRRYYPGNP